MNLNDERWAEDRLRTLDPVNDWRPDPAAALAAVHKRDRRRRTLQRGWIWSTAMASVAAIAMIVLPAPATCALARVGCPRPATALQVAAPHTLTAVPLPPPVVKAVPAARAANYKQYGSAGAPIVCEIYTDYECPSCANFYRVVFPKLVAEFVKTGKVRILHRDYPLPQHPFAKLAARYANAAGELGHYDDAVTQLFASQPEWAANGNVDAAVAQAVPAETMLKIRARVETDPKLDETVAADVSMAAQDRIDRTPTIVLVSKGIRRKVAGVQSFDLVRTYIDELLRP